VATGQFDAGRRDALRVREAGKKAHALAPPVRKPLVVGQPITSPGGFASWPASGADRQASSAR